MPRKRPPPPSSAYQPTIPAKRPPPPPPPLPPLWLHLAHPQQQVLSHHLALLIRRILETHRTRQGGRK